MDQDVTETLDLLPSIARDVATWFPELDGRALAVSDAQVTKENVPNLPIAMVALVRGISDQPPNGGKSILNLTDDFVIEFWLKPARYTRSDGAQSPFWSYYDYPRIRNRLLSHLAANGYQGPNGERISYRSMQLEVDTFAVQLSFTFRATYQWCADEIEQETGEGEPITPLTFATNICAPKGDLCPPCFYPEPEPECDPCQDLLDRARQHELDSRPTNGD